MKVQHLDSRCDQEMNSSFDTGDTIDCQSSPSKELEQLLRDNILSLADWNALDDEARHEIARSPNPPTLLAALVDKKLLTQYQAERIADGGRAGLIIGNYRILDQIGHGGMGVVYKAEHVRMRRMVAIKLMNCPAEVDSRIYRRFIQEMQALARLQHPNIVNAIDDGEIVAVPGLKPSLHYFVMELVPGQDLEDMVRNDGPLRVEKACGIIYQIASALAEAHRHGLVHRDIKPSNIKVTPAGQAKLLDFGLVRRGSGRLTEPGTILGTLDYMAPEQARDASTVDIRADIFGLGGTLFWCLTGTTPYPQANSFYESLMNRATQKAPSLPVHFSPELSILIERMMASEPEERLPTPQAVLTAMLPFLGPPADHASEALPSSRSIHNPKQLKGEGRGVLVVDDRPDRRRQFAHILTQAGTRCDAVESGDEALAIMKRRSYDVVVCNLLMPTMSGLKLCRRIRSRPPTPNVKILLFSDVVHDEDIANSMSAGADDFLPQNTAAAHLVARVKSALRTKELQDKVDDLTGQLANCHKQLEENLSASALDLRGVRNALMLALADLVCIRDIESPSHILRVQSYSRYLATVASSEPAFYSQIDDAFVELLECCAPLHDIGKSALPDRLLTNSGNETEEERLMMQSHTIHGAETLQQVARSHGPIVGFLQMAIDIARSHHERFDGKGYPDHLTGNSIPLAARIVAIADAYDCLRSRRLFKPGLSHESTLQLMLNESEGQFDPILLRVFKTHARAFDDIFQKNPR